MMLVSLGCRAAVQPCSRAAVRPRFVHGEGTDRPAG